MPSKRRSGNRPSQDRTDTRETRKTIGPFYNRENIRRNIRRNTHTYLYIHIYMYIYIHTYIHTVCTCVNKLQSYLSPNLKLYGPLKIFLRAPRVLQVRQQIYSNCDIKSARVPLYHYKQTFPFLIPLTRVLYRERSHPYYKQKGNTHPLFI